jgi:hypothetical protein
MTGAVPVCILLGLFDTGLAVLRTLARAGLPVTGLESRTDRSGVDFRYGSLRMCPAPATEPEALVRYPTSGRGQP